MQAVNNKIIVRCDVKQKDTVTIGGVVFRMANLYENNYRIKSPNIATVIEGNEVVKFGDILLIHHNCFYMPSPYFLYGDVFSIPFSSIIFAKILQNGDLLPICGNLLGERIAKKYDIPVTPDAREMYNDRMVITNSGYTKYKKGQTVFARPSSCYDIIYHFESEIKVATKIHESMICGILLS